MPYIRRIHRILGVYKLRFVSSHLLPSPAGRRSTPLSPLSWPNLICSFVPGIGSTCYPEGSTAVDPPSPKGQQALTLFGLLQKPNVSLEVLPLSDVNAKEDLPRTPEAAQGPLREIPDDLNAQKCNKNQWFFNDFEMALNALGGAQTSPRGPPWPPSPPERWHRAPTGAPWTAQHESEVPKVGSNRGRGIKKIQSG